MNTELELVEVFDTTLRDGLQVEGVSATVDDKLRIAEQLDHLGVHFIEGGWPGANPKDIEFFARALKELRLGSSTMVAFGSTRRPRGKVDDDATLRNLLDAQTAAVCIVAKSWDYQVTEALQTTLDEGVAMIADSVEFLRGAGRMVMVDLEHFFDGYKRNPEFSLRAIEAAVVKGASHLVLCDTNGGSLPHEVSQIVADVKRHVGDDAVIGIHCHDDTGCAVANTMKGRGSGNDAASEVPRVSGMSTSRNSRSVRCSLRKIRASATLVQWPTTLSCPLFRQQLRVNSAATIRSSTMTQFIVILKWHYNRIIFKWIV